MATANNNEVGFSHRPTTGHESGWRIFWGLVLIASGVLAILMPAIAALATAVVFAWLLIVSGIGEIAYALQTRQSGGFGWKLTVGVLTLVLGIAVLLMPIAGVASLALLVGGFLFVGGVTRTLLAWRLKPQRSWGWVLFDGLLSIVLAILIAIGWPQSSLPIIGLLTGFSLLSAGIWRILLTRRQAD